MISAFPSIVIFIWHFIIYLLIGMQEEDPLGSFNYNYVKAVQHFEMLALEGQELNFHHFKLQVNGNEDN